MRPLPRRSFAWAFVFAPFVSLVPLAVSGCGSEEGATVDADAGATGDATVFGDPVGIGPCMARTQNFVGPPKNHVPVGTDIVYNVTNPPCGGPHYPIWAAFQEYDVPVDRRYYVHSQEHGAIVLAYKCDSRAACPELADALRQIRDALPSDPKCASFDTRVRVVLTPDPLLARQIGVAAWGWSYSADCIDAVSIGDFIREHYGKGVEDLCNPGMSTF